MSSPMATCCTSASPTDGHGEPIRFREHSRRRDCRIPRRRSLGRGKGDIVAFSMEAISKREASKPNCGLVGNSFRGVSHSLARTCSSFPASFWSLPQATSVACAAN